MVLSDNKDSDFLKPDFQKSNKKFRMRMGEDDMQENQAILSSEYL